MKRYTVAFALLTALGLLALGGPYVFSMSSYQLDVSRLALYQAGLVATWSLLAGVAGQFSFAHVAIAGLAGYAGAIWTREMMTVSPVIGSVWFGLIFGTAFAAAVGTLLGLLLLRLKGAYLSLFTIAFAEITRLVIVAESELTGGRMSLAVMQIPGTSRTHYYVILVATLILLGAIYALLWSHVGLFLRAMREDAEAAAALGLNHTRLKVFVFSLTSLLIGMLASLYFHTTPRLVPENLDLLGMSLVIAYAVIGGLESPLAGALAAVGMTFALEALRRIQVGNLQFETGVWRFAIFGVLLVVTLRLARNGLLTPLLDYLSGGAQRRRETVANREAVETGSTTSQKPPQSEKLIVLRHHDIGPQGPIDLRAVDLRLSFDGLHVLQGISFAITGPQICGLIGPNGAGKTTLTNVLSGIYQPTGGALYLRGERVDGLPPHEIARRGLGRTFQVTRAFKRMTVLENLLIPALAIQPGRKREAVVAQAMEVLAFLNLTHLANEYARALSGGQQKLLELARLLMLNPDVLILDEPFAGVHPRLKELIHRFVQRIRDNGKAIIIIEHDMDTIFSISERLLVLSGGVLISDGPPEAVKRDPAVIAAYLGEEESDGDERAGTSAVARPGEDRYARSS